jgi:hypothetical protein
MTVCSAHGAQIVSSSYEPILAAPTASSATPSISVFIFFSEYVVRGVRVKRIVGAEE